MCALGQGGPPVAGADGGRNPGFEPPGPGSWLLDPVHFPRPVTRYFAQTHPEPVAAGTSEFARFFGMLGGGLKIAYVNGFAYNQMQPPPDDEVPGRLALGLQTCG